MLRLEWTTRFERNLKKWIEKHPTDYSLIRSKLEIFTQSPYEKELKNHKLSGQLSGLRAITIRYDCRIVFSMVDDNTAMLVSIGTHDEVY